MGPLRFLLKLAAALFVLTLISLPQFGIRQQWPPLFGISWSSIDEGIIWLWMILFSLGVIWIFVASPRLIKVAEWNISRSQYIRQNKLFRHKLGSFYYLIMLWMGLFLTSFLFVVWRISVFRSDHPDLSLNFGSLHLSVFLMGIAGIYTYGLIQNRFIAHLAEEARERESENESAGEGSA